MFPHSTGVNAGILGSLLLCFGIGLASVHADDPVPVVVDIVRVGAPSNIVRMTGSVFSRRYSKLSSEVEGLVSKLMVDLGNYVSKGDVLCRMDATFAQLDADDAQARLQRTNAAAAEAQRQLDEGTRLSQERIIAESDIQTLRSQLRIAETEVRRMEILQTRAQESLKRFEIVAPFDGMIVGKETEEGEWVTRGGHALTLVELDTVFVEFLVPQSYYHRLDRGKLVRTRFESLPDRDFHGKIHGLVALASESARSFPVRIELENRDHSVVPGMSARGFFEMLSDESSSVVFVPADAIVRTPQGQSSVWVVLKGSGPEHKVEEKLIRLGRQQGTEFVLVAGDLAGGEQVVVRGNERLERGATVSIVGR